MLDKGHEMKDVSNHLRIAEFAQKNFHGRRDYEWKVTLGLWALLATAIVLASERKLTLDHPWSSPMMPVAVVAIFAVLWVRPVWVANENDKRLSHRFLFMSARALDPAFRPSLPDGKPIRPRHWSWWFGFVFDWAAIFQIATTAALAVTLASVLETRTTVGREAHVQPSSPQPIPRTRAKLPDEKLPAPSIK